MKRTVPIVLFICLAALAFKATYTANASPASTQDYALTQIKPFIMAAIGLTEEEECNDLWESYKTACNYQQYNDWIDCLNIWDEEDRQACLNTADQNHAKCLKSKMAQFCHACPGAPMCIGSIYAPCFDIECCLSRANTMDSNCATAMAAQQAVCMLIPVGPDRTQCLRDVSLAYVDCTDNVFNELVECLSEMPVIP